MELRCDYAGLSDILGVGRTGISKLIKRGTLDKRLNELGYRINRITKESRKKIYWLIEVPMRSCYIRNVLGIRKEYEFAKYFSIKTRNTYSFDSRISENINVDRKTLKRWRDKMVDSKMLVKDGFYYFRCDSEGLHEVDIWEYKNFWKNRADLENMQERLQSQFYKNKVSFKDCLNKFGKMSSELTAAEGKMYFKVHKYRVNKNNEAYQITSKEAKELLYNWTRVFLANW